MLKGNTSSTLPPPEPKKQGDSRAKQACQVRHKAAPEDVFFASKAALPGSAVWVFLFVVTGPAACKYLSTWFP